MWQNPGLGHNCQQCAIKYAAMYTYKVMAHRGNRVLSGIPENVGKLSTCEWTWLQGYTLTLFYWGEHKQVPH